MFESKSLLTGLFFFAGIAVNDRRAALYALYGALLPLCVAFFLNDFSAFNAGMYGYNAILCALALAGRHAPILSAPLLPLSYPYYYNLSA